MRGSGLVRYCAAVGVAACLGLIACNRQPTAQAPGNHADSASAVTAMPSGPFADDLAFLKQHTSVVLLTGPGGAQVAVSPAYQGRVMTSTTGGANAQSFGWLGRAAI